MFANFFKRFCLDLTDALARDAECFAHFFKRVADAVIQAKPHLQNLLFALREIYHDLFDKIAKHRAGGELRRRRDYARRE